MSRSAQIVRLNEEAADLLTHLAKITAVSKSQLASQLILKSIPKLDMEPRMVRVYTASLFGESITGLVGEEVVNP